MSQDNRKPRVLVCDPIAEAGIRLLEQHADVDIKLNLSATDLHTVIANYEAVIIHTDTQITAEHIDHAVHLRVIGRVGTGLDNVDIAASRQKNIAVVNSPGAYTLAVAEHTVALMLAMARQLPFVDARLKGGDWSSQPMGIGLSGKTLGIIGFGRIGREVAVRAEAFGMRILINQKRPTPEMDLDSQINNVDLDELLAQSDFVSLHIPVRPETIGLISADRLSKMKPSAYLINTARGEVVDNNALFNALNNNMLAGAAIDVWDHSQDEILIQHPKVVATPRIAAHTEDAQQQATLTTVEQVVEILQDIEVENVLPLKVVAMDKIFPHESIDQKRVDRLAGRLKNEGILSNPPIVTEVEGKYMVLDGATRTAALKQLGYPHTVVQISTPESGLDLHTWYHVAQKIPADKLLQIIDDIPDISLVSVDAEKAADDMFAYGALCYISFVDGSTYLVQPAIGINRLDALNKLTETYIEASFVDRTLESDLANLRYEYPEMTAVIVFPEYTVSQVMQVTLSGRYFPAGITRFVIPGRILRINADLNYLKSDKPLSEKNKWLNQLLEEKIRDNAIRYYREPVYLLDE